MVLVQQREKGGKERRSQLSREYHVWPAGVSCKLLNIKHVGINSATTQPACGGASPKPEEWRRAMLIIFVLIQCR